MNFFEQTRSKISELEIDIENLKTELDDNKSELKTLIKNQNAIGFGFGLIGLILMLIMIIVYIRF